MAVKKPIDVVVLNAVQAAAADAALAGGKFDITGLSSLLKLSDVNSITFDAYAAGTASVKNIDFTAATLLADYQYRVAVKVPGKISFNGSGQEANQLIPIREYVIYSGSTTPTAAGIAQLFVDRINADLGADVSATLQAGDILQLTLTNDLLQGDFNVEFPDGCTTAVVTPFVAPSGLPSQVEVLKPGSSSASAQYDTYTISFNQKRRHAAVTGGLVEFPEDIKIFINSLDADADDLEDEIDAIFDGSHTPVADYLGV